MARILIIEDDQHIAESMANALRPWGHEVFCQDGTGNVPQTLQTHQAELVVLDIGLPQKNGFYWCEILRRQSNLPILIVSAQDADLDIVMGMTTGADDYLTKPFSLQVFVARVQALLRRAYHYTAKTTALTCQGATLYPDMLTLSFHNQDLPLTATEMTLLTQLFQNAGHFVRRESLTVALWQQAEFIDDNTLSVNISRLRTKLSDIGLADFIKTKKGYGYGVDTP